MNNPPDPRPVYEADQVLTLYDISAIRNGYIYQYQHLPWFELKRKWVLRIGVGVCNEMLHWLAHGKPQNGIKCGGQHGA